MTYLDTNILIYLFENHPEYGRRAADEITQLQAHGPLICSTLTVTECLAQVSTITIETFRALPGLRLVSVDEHIAEQAARLQRASPLRIGDAIHLATALSQDVTLFFTNDKQLARIAADFLEVKTL